MERQRLINLDRITCITIAERGGTFYLVFQDGRHNYGYRVSNLEYAQKALKHIEQHEPKWWRVLGEPIEVSYKKND